MKKNFLIILLPITIFVPGYGMESSLSYIPQQSEKNLTLEQILVKRFGEKQNGMRTEIQIEEERVFKFYISKRGSVKKKSNYILPHLQVQGFFGHFASDEFVLVAPLDTWSTYLSSFLKSKTNCPENSTIALSLNNQYLLSFMRSRDALGHSILSLLWAVDLSSGKKSSIALPKIRMQSEVEKIYAAKDVKKLLSEGYSVSKYIVNNVICYCMTNNFYIGAISNDGLKIAIANNGTVYLISLAENSCQEVKKISGVVEIDYNKLEYGALYEYMQPKRIAVLAFNNDGTQLGIHYSESSKVIPSIEVIDI